MIQELIKKVDNDYIVWFEKSNQWIKFEEPAWFVCNLLRKGLDRHIILHKLSNRYNISKIDGIRFIEKVKAAVAVLAKSIAIETEENQSVFIPINKIAKPYSIRRYLIGNRYFQIKFETRLSEYYIHPPLAHLEVFYLAEVICEFEIKNNGRTIILNENNLISYTFDDFMRLKKRLYIQIANLIYNKTNDSWLSLVHASALTNGKFTIILSSASGSGKSTMTAMLLKEGLKFVSDDFVPIDARTKKVFPFPAAISIKKGSFDTLSSLYWESQDNVFKQNEYFNNSLRYLSPNSKYLTSEHPRPLRNIVFIQYNPAVLCEFKLLPQIESLKLFHEQAWVSSNPKHARTFINWFLKVPCYRLEYGNSKQGISKIMELFES